MSVQWQLIEDARSNLDTARIANNALIALHIFGNAKYKNPPMDPGRDIRAGRGLLLEMKCAAAGRHRKSIPASAYSALFVFTRSSKGGRHMVLEFEKAINELDLFLYKKTRDAGGAAKVFEKIVSASSSQADIDLLKVRGE